MRGLVIAVIIISANFGEFKINDEHYLNRRVKFHRLFNNFQFDSPASSRHRQISCLSVQFGDRNFLETFLSPSSAFQPRKKFRGKQQQKSRRKCFLIYFLLINLSKNVSFLPTPTTFHNKVCHQIDQALCVAINLYHILCAPQASQTIRLPLPSLNVIIIITKQ